jgi:hypothetical protein
MRRLQFVWTGTCVTVETEAVVELHNIVGQFSGGSLRSHC